MDLPAELKSRLSPYLSENSGLDEFRIWFADVLRTANQYEESNRNLVWSIDSWLAQFGSGRIPQAQLRAALTKIVHSLDYAQITTASGEEHLKSASSNVPQVAAGMVLEESPVYVGRALGYA
jgi:hypothetical protein